MGLLNALKATLAACFLICTCEGKQLVYEGFDAEPGQLLPEDGGYGLAGGWHFTPGDTYSETQYRLASGSLIGIGSTDSFKLERPGVRKGQQASLYRKLAEPLGEMGTVKYLGFVLKTASYEGLPMLWPIDAHFGVGLEGAESSVFLGGGSRSQGMKFNLSRFAGGAGSAGGDRLEWNTTYVCVLQMEFTPSGTVCSMYINPDGAGEPTATYWVQAGLLDTLAIVSNYSFAVDEIRITDSFQELYLTAPPEQPELTIAETSVNEGNSGITLFEVPVRLNRASTFDVSAEYAIVAIGAEQNDFIPSSGKVQIPAGAMTAVIPVQIGGDKIFEEEDDLRIILTNLSGARDRSPQPIRIRIINDEDPSRHLKIAFEGEQKGVKEWREGGFIFSSEAPFDIRKRVSESEPENGTAALFFPTTNRLTIRSETGAPFRIVSHEIAEFNRNQTVQYGRSEYTVEGNPSPNQHGWVLDGVIDGTGPKKDFQKTSAGSSIKGLTSYTFMNAPFCLDNMVLIAGDQERTYLEIHASRAHLWESEDPNDLPPYPNSGAASVRRIGDTSKEVWFNIAIAGTADHLRDYTIESYPEQSFKLLPGQTSLQLGIFAPRDGEDEGIETVELTLSSPEGYAVVHSKAILYIHETEWSAWHGRTHFSQDDPNIHELHPDEDEDRNGLSNITEFFMGLDPWVRATGGPKYTFTQIPGAIRVECRLRKSEQAFTSIVFEKSLDLKEWSRLVTTETVEVQTSDYQILVFRFDLPQGENTFVRLGIEPLRW